MKRALIALAAATVFATPAFAEDIAPGENLLAPVVHTTQITLKERAIGTAIGDSVSTQIALNTGAVESNPLINTSVAGLVGLAVLKYGIVELVDQSDMAQRDKDETINTMGSLWGGVTVSNLLVAAGATNPVSLGVGLVAGLIMWHSGKEQIAATEYPAK